MKLKNNWHSIIAVFLGVVMSLTLLCTAVMAEEETESYPTLELPVMIVLSGDYPSSEKYTVVLKAADASTPMPEGTVETTYTLTITGAGEATFPPIVFNRVGVYNYTVWQEEGSDADCTYDDTVYEVTVYVTNKEGGGFELTVVSYEKNGNGDKCDIIFENYYEYDNIIPYDLEETEPETKPETKPIETKPAETEPEETKPAETEPAETEPSETEPEESEPIETKSEETKPNETDPIETEPEYEETLVQTGQLNWPISVLSVGGMGFVAAGCLFLRGDKNKKDKEEDDE